MSELYYFYKKKVIFKLMNLFNYSSIMQVPKIIKVILNIGIGKLASDKKILNNILKNLSNISGQKPIITKSHKSIAGFKIRQGFPIGCKVTLRKKYMWIFLEKLIYISIPRIRDFRGLSKKSFDGFGNYNLGIKEQIIFPEINYDKSNKINGLNITINTTATSNNEAYSLLKNLGFPFNK